MFGCYTEFNVKYRRSKNRVLSVFDVFITRLQNLNLWEQSSVICVGVETQLSLIAVITLLFWCLVPRVSSYFPTY
jgi:hypothetical protein